MGQSNRGRGARPRNARPRNEVAPRSNEGLRAIDRVRSASVLTRRCIEVPEWDGLKLYFNKLTVADMNGVSDREPKSNWERNILLLILKAQNEDGTPAFQMGDKHVLMTEADYVVVQRVVNFMFETAYTDINAAEQRIEGDPTSASSSTSGAD